MAGLGGFVSPTGAAATDRRTFLELKNELAMAANPDDEVTLAIAGMAINAAIRSYNRYNWPWEVLEQDISISSGTESYALTQPFKAPLSCYLLESSRPHNRLGFIPWTSFINEYSHDYDGQPTIYTLENVHENSQITFWPRPQSSYTARLWYYRRTPVMKNDSEPFEALPEAEEAYMAWAWYEFVKRLGGDWLNRLGTAYADARSARAELVAMVAERGDQIGVL